MSDEAPLLSEELLDGLLARWAAAGLPLAPALRRGLSDAEMDELTAPLGLRLPGEARLWWGRHDGAPSATPDGRRLDRRLTRSFDYLPLADCVDIYRECRRLAEESAAEMGSFRAEMAHPDHFFHRALFPITDSGGAGIVVCDCSVPDGAPTPIRRIEPAEMAEGLPAPKAPSFGAMVVRWIEAWDRPLWGYDAAAGRWVEYPENRTEADNRSRLV